MSSNISAAKPELVFFNIIFLILPTRVKILAVFDLSFPPVEVCPLTEYAREMRCFVLRHRQLSGALGSTVF